MKTKINLSLTLSVIIGIAMSAFTVLCYVKYVNPDSLLTINSTAMTVYGVLCALSVLIMLAIPLFTFKDCDVTGETPNTSFVIFSSSLLGFLFAGYFLHAMYTLLSEKSAVAFSSAYADVSYAGLLKVLYILSIVFSVPSAVYFIMLALKKTLNKSNALAVLATFPLLFFAARLIYTFMDTSARVNIAGRKINIVSVCLCVLYFLYEANLCMDSERTEVKTGLYCKISKRYLAVGYAAISAMLISQLSTTLLQAFWLLEPKETYIMNGINITMILYIIAKISALSPLKNEQ